MPDRVALDREADATLETMRLHACRLERRIALLTRQVVRAERLAEIRARQLRASRAALCEALRAIGDRDA